MGLTAGFPNLGLKPPSVILPDVAEDDLSPLAGEQADRGGADALRARRAGDEGDLPLKSHGSLPSRVLGYRRKSMRRKPSA